MKSRAVPRHVTTPAGTQVHPDAVAVEEPLEIRVAGTPLAVLLRTPGQDEDLAVGFCLTEHVLTSAADVESVVPCASAPVEAAGNIVDVRPVQGVVPDVVRFRTPRFSNSACGVCGTATLDNLLRLHGVLAPGRTLTHAQVQQATVALGQQQPGFQATGGLHGAGVLAASGPLLCVREDVGRHNATDKALGAYALQHGDEPPLALVVSSRAGFEIVQKAHARRVPVVISVGAPTTLALDTAHAAGITVVAFARPGTFATYTHAHRVVP